MFVDRALNKERKKKTIEKIVKDIIQMLTTRKHRNHRL